MAHLRKREKWLDHARAMIEGKSLAKTAQLCGVHPTAPSAGVIGFCAPPASDKPRGLSGIVEADETFILESFKGRWSDLPRASHVNGAARLGIRGPIRTIFPFSSPATSATFDAVPPQVDGASEGAALAGVVTQDNL